MQQCSVLNLVDDKFGMRDVIERSAAFRAAAEVIDSAIAEQCALEPVDGLYREVPALQLLERAEREGVSAHSVQFVLNAIKTDAYTFGGRIYGTLVSMAEVVALMRATALASRGGVKTPQEAAECVIVHRFSAEALAATA